MLRKKLKSLPIKDEYLKPVYKFIKEMMVVGEGEAKLEVSFVDKLLRNDDEK